MAEDEINETEHLDEGMEVVEEAPHKDFNLEEFIEEKKRPLLITGGALLVVVVAVIYVFVKWLPDRNLDGQNTVFFAQNAFATDSFQQVLSGGRKASGGSFVGVKQVAGEFSWTAIGNLCYYYEGISYLNMKKYNDAITALDKFKTSEPIIGAVKLSALGDAYTELGKFDEGLRYYEKAADFNDNERFTPYYLFKAGLLYEKLKKYADAKKCYEKIRDNYPKSDEGVTISKYLARVNTH